VIPAADAPAPPVAADPAAADVRGMFDRIAGRYDAANRAMSGGIDVLWRRRAMKELLAGLGEAPRILDLGAGTLDGALEIVRRKPGARVVGADFAREMLKVGVGKVATTLGEHAGHIAAHAADGHHLPYATGVFDGAFSGFCVRNLARLPVALAELRRVVRPGGTICILEFFRPRKPRLFFDKLYNARLLPLIGWAITGNKEAYQYLPASIGRFLSREEFEDALRTAGFAEVKGNDLFPAAVASLVVAR
jgi:demethylmenaquinone methyltransferase/2-methoxy-6-polyprenyl-1,4-benzoquinol methylase